MKTEKPDWLKTKEAHDNELVTYSLNGRDTLERPRSHGATYGPTESRVDQVGDGLIDVNDLMKRFERMPTAEELRAAGLTGEGFYADFIGAPDYEKAVQIATAAKNQFALLPANVRARFENDPQQFLAFVNDPANSEEAIYLGIKKKPEPKPEPEITLKDVNETLKGALKPKKTAGEGGKDHDS